MNSKTPIRCKWNWSRPCATAGFTAGKLFLVGDKKQSIYRFRGADPDVFCDLRQQIPVEGRLPLSENFRSQPAVLEFINALFAEELASRRAYEPFGRSAARSARGRPSSCSGRSSRKKVGVRVRCPATPRPHPRAHSPEAERGVPAGPRHARRADAAARGGLHRPARPRAAGFGREDRVAERRRERDGPGRRPRRHRHPLPRLDRRGLLRRGPAALGHRLLPGRRPRLLRPAGNLRRGQPAAVAGQSGRRGEPGGRAAEPAVRPAGRDAFLAGAAGKRIVGAGCLPRSCPPNWTRSRPAGACRGCRHARCAAGHEGPRAHRAIAPGGAGADRLRRRAAGRIPRPAETGQPQEARGPGAELRPGRACSRSTTSSPSFRSSSPGSPTSRWRPRSRRPSTLCG